MDPYLTYNLVDRNQPLYKCSSDSNLDIFHEMLVKIDNILTFMINSQIVPTNLDSLNFDNLECIITRKNYSNLSNDKQSPIIINVYKFNIKEFAFIGLDGNKISVDSTLLFLSNDFAYTWSQLKQKIQCLSTSDKKQLTSTKNNLKQKEQKSQNPIKKLFEETHKVIGSISTNNNLTKRAIPTVDTSSEGDDGDDENEQSDENEQIDENKKNEEINVLNVNLPRPMDSILLKGDDNFSDISPVTLKKTIDALENLKQQEEKTLKELEQINEGDTENFSKFCNNLGDVKREFLKNQEREQERRNKFEANKSAYRKMKQHIEEGKITEKQISPLFINDYPIYKFMDDHEIMDKPDDYIVYLSLYDELYPEKKTVPVTTYVPHNIHYLSDEEQKKYLTIKNDSKNIIEEFMHSQNSTSGQKKYPSVDEILEQVDDNEFNVITFDTKSENKLDTIATALLDNLQ